MTLLPQRPSAPTEVLGPTRTDKTALKMTSGDIRAGAAPMDLGSSELQQQLAEEKMRMCHRMREIQKLEVAAAVRVSDEEDVMEEILSRRRPEAGVRRGHTMVGSKDHRQPLPRASCAWQLVKGLEGEEEKA